jgi:hypothetical protein
MSKRFMIKLALFLIGLIAVDRVTATLLRQGFKYTEMGQAVHSLREGKEVIVLGSSRAKYHFDPEVLQDNLKLGVYNAGIDGHGIPSARCMLEVALSEHKPEMVLVNVDPRQVLMSFRDQFNRTAGLSPLITQYSSVRRFIYQRSTLERLKYLSASYRYNNTGLSILRSVSMHSEAVDGFVPKRGQLPEDVAMAPLQEDNSDQPEIDPESVEVHIEMIQACKRANVKIVFVFTPKWSPTFELPADDLFALNVVEQITVSQNVPFIRVTQQNAPVFQDPSLFVDVAHLNARGAALFSQILADRLIELERSASSAQ